MTARRPTVIVTQNNKTACSLECGEYVSVLACQKYICISNLLYLPGLNSTANEGLSIFTNTLYILRFYENWPKRKFIHNALTSWKTRPTTQHTWKIRPKIF